MEHLTAADITSSPVRTVPEGTTLSEGVERIYREARRRTVVEIMSSPVHTVETDTSLRELLDLMMKRDVKHVPVMERETAVGMVARHDLLKVIHRQLTA